MPSKKKKYNARFPSGRIKKIMQTDEEVGKVAQAVPVIISRTLELFVESLLTKAMQITSARNAKTLTPSHMKQCILSESRFDFLKDLVKSLPDATIGDSEEGPMPVNLSVHTPMNSNVQSDNSSRFQGNSARAYSRQSSGTTEQVHQVREWGNGTNAHFQSENLVSSDDYITEGPFLSQTCPKAEVASTSSDEEYDDLISDYKAAQTSDMILSTSCVDVDEDYDT